MCFFALLACVAAKPHIIAPVSYATPVAAAVAAPVYTAPYYTAAYASPYYSYSPFAAYTYAGAPYFFRRR